MRTADTARELGISPDWLRRLERAGRIPPASRDLNGHRRFSQADIERLRAVVLGEGSRSTDNGGRFACQAPELKAEAEARI
jgi:Helix-turn-helix domain